ncbi:MAG: hypothetical protein ACLF0G_00550 [Candidatus Brocadiia bacterium]
MAEKVSVRKMRRLRGLLAENYQMPPPPEPKDSTLDQIVMTVLWHEAPPARARLAYVNLSDEFVDWNELRVSVTRDVAAVLEACGLAPRKGAVLKRILGRAIEEFYSFDFEQLREWPRERLKAWFTDIDGVPHHVAAAVLYQVYEYDRALVGEDIARVLRRLGLVSEEATEEAIEEGLDGVVPAREAHFFHAAMRQHALNVCTKKDPACSDCPLLKECVAGKERLAELEAARKAEEEAKRKKKAKAKKKKKKAKKKRPAAKKTKTKKTKKTTKKAKKRTTKKRTTRKASKKKSSRKKSSTRKSKK